MTEPPLRSLCWLSFCKLTQTLEEGPQLRIGASAEKPAAFRLAHRPCLWSAVLIAKTYSWA